MNTTLAMPINVQEPMAERVIATELHMHVASEGGTTIVVVLLMFTIHKNY